MTVPVVANREPGWRELLDVAIDAMILGQTEISEPIFEELDKLAPGWQIEVPYAMATRHERADHKQRYAENEARCVLAAICAWAGASRAAMATWFGVSTERVRLYIGRGEQLISQGHRRFAVGHPHGVYRTSYEMKHPGQHLSHWWPRTRNQAGPPLLEEDWPPEEERRTARRAAVFERDHRMLRSRSTLMSSASVPVGTPMDVFYCSCGFHPSGQNPDDELATHFATARASP